MNGETLAIIILGIALIGTGLAAWVIAHHKQQLKDSYAQYRRCSRENYEKALEDIRHLKETNGSLRFRTADLIHGIGQLECFQNECPEPVLTAMKIGKEIRNQAFPLSHIEGFEGKDAEAIEAMRRLTQDGKVKSDDWVYLCDQILHDDKVDIASDIAFVAKATENRQLTEAIESIRNQ